MKTSVRMKRIIIAIAAMVLSLTALQIVQADEMLRLKQYTDTLSSSNDRNELNQAFENLSKFEPKTEQEIDFLISAIGQADKNVSQAAQQALLNVKDSNLVPKIISVLENKDVKRSKGSQEDVNVKVATIGALGKMRDKRAVPALVKNLDESEYITGRASSALAEIGDESAIPELLSRIGKRNAPTSLALAKFGAPALTQIVKQLDVEKGKRKRTVSAEGEDERFRLIQSIVSIKDPQAVPQLRDLLKNEDSEVREAAVRALGNMGELNIAEALKDSDPVVRILVVSASQKVNDPALIPLLIEAFVNDKSEGVRNTAARVLGEKKSAVAIPYLEAALNDDNKRVRSAAKRALAKINGEEN